jgi:hypothetical protein
MCHRVTCRTCNKPTYRGCGMHVEQVLAGVPKSQRCGCDRTQKSPAGGWAQGRAGDRVKPPPMASDRYPATRHTR